MDRKLLQKIREMANSSSWEVRESAASEIKKINDKYFHEYVDEWKKWIKDKNPNIRRAVEVGFLRLKKEDCKKGLLLLYPLLFDNNVYVRKNCGPFAISSVAWKIPDFAFKKFNEWIKNNDENLRWNIAMCMGVWFGTTYPSRALKVLKKLSTDKRRFVWRAVASSLIKLLRRYPKYKREVYQWKNAEDCLKVVKQYMEENKV